MALRSKYVSDQEYDAVQADRNSTKSIATSHTGTEEEREVDPWRHGRLLLEAHTDNPNTYMAISSHCQFWSNG